ncbi:hypothetical protein BHE97_03595 [Aeromicrobium sp. PE09-221]|uniref:1-phosphofructokinase family hexose kinase n=1 Tax=Aeromicrobium sp. PE09-221 TaxID=1898043 RepID=UPI000B6E90CC|nr:hexose kinase [Aeromicrobium sp. PE09-221]OUZ12001.1 hypothetical protein BHE97_03595 [Aeromicrobium sp. PE09-221]
MIVTVTCNPAIDLTYRIPHLVPGSVHRVASVERRAGGKGVNVARVLHRLGRPVVATGFADGHFADELEAIGLTTRFVSAMDRVRQTLVVHDNQQVTSLWEPGNPIHDGAEARLLGIVTELLQEAKALVVSGSLPAGAANTLPTTLAHLARDVGVPAVLDLDDEPLAIAAQRSAAVLTPNHEELGRLLGTAENASAAAATLATTTGAPVVVTLGADGMLASTGTQTWRVRPLEVLSGNPTGAGDAAAAAIAAGLSEAQPWPDILIQAVALSASAVNAPVAGEIDLDTYRSWQSRLEVEPLRTPGDER